MHLSEWFLNVSLQVSGTVPEQSHKHRKSSVTVRSMPEAVSDEAN